VVRFAPLGPEITRRSDYFYRFADPNHVRKTSAKMVKTRDSEGSAVEGIENRL
jgi:hypothetical protein